eukprot:GHUV01033201.1.p1 GENE.GHUV01033201.1~~GHUV01033201.1.p1  ORF type:complete len:115 (-),score=16.36 GHUV01033201.1:143-487(-)
MMWRLTLIPFTNELVVVLDEDAQQEHEEGPKDGRSRTGRASCRRSKPTSLCNVGRAATCAKFAKSGAATGLRRRTGHATHLLLLSVLMKLAHVLPDFAKATGSLEAQAWYHHAD